MYVLQTPITRIAQKVKARKKTKKLKTVQMKRSDNVDFLSLFWFRNTISQFTPKLTLKCCYAVSNLHRILIRA